VRSPLPTHLEQLNVGLALRLSICKLRGTNLVKFVSHLTQSLDLCFKVCNAVVLLAKLNATLTEELVVLLLSSQLSDNTIKTRLKDVAITHGMIS
jgi:hypothetical protein